jgi:hypothetical protein
MSVINAFYTTVINSSGVERAFGFLGKHGMRLGAAEQVTQPGNLANGLASDMRTLRKFHALERSVARGDLTIINTPATYLLDSTQHKTQVMTLTGGALGVSLPAAIGAGGSYTQTAPTGTFTTITTPTTSPVSTATVTFSTPVSGFTVADLVLTLAAAPVALSGLTLATTDRKVYTISGLTPFTGTAGAYVLTIPHTTAGIVDGFGNALAVDVSVTWTHS